MAKLEVRGSIGVPSFFMKTFRTTLALSLLSVCIVSQAATFPDVAADYQYKPEIDQLVFKNILKGNADGTFRPSSPVHRAALVVMLYRASNRLPPAPQKICDKTVLAGVWYEAAVCDALRQRFVSGYEERGFMPDKIVTRAEALKMVETIMEFDLTLGSIKDFAPPAITDVSDGDWYVNYVYHAYAKKILPIKGWMGTSLLPNTPLSRGEAAALIYNALLAKGMSTTVDNPFIQEETESTGSDADPTLQQRREEEEKKAEERAAQVRLLKKDLPINDSQTFDKKKPFSFQFTLKHASTVDIVASLTQGQAGGITARLFKLDASGLSTEYYLGFAQGASAYLLNALEAGSYQIDLQPKNAESTSFSIQAKVASGDSNDGFSQAKNLDTNPVRTESLEANDLQDFFRFTVAPMADGQTKSMSIDISSQQEVGCIIYGLSNVDFYGENFPECGKAYAYPSGSYMIAISRGAKATRAERYTYTVKLSK